MAVVGIGAGPLCSCGCLAGDRGQPAAPARPNWPGTISAGWPVVGLSMKRSPEGLGGLGEPRADARPWVRGGSGPPNRLVDRASFIPPAWPGCSHPPAVPAHAPNPTSPLPQGGASPCCSDRRGQLRRARIISHLVPGAVTIQSRMLKDRRSLSKGPLLVGVLSALSSPILAPMSGLAGGHLEVHVAMRSHRAPQLAKAGQRPGMRDGNKVTFLPQTICSGSVEIFHLFGPYCCSWDNFISLSCRD